MIDKLPQDERFDSPKENTLYTICYTSGTTGNPKGVKVTHANIVSFIIGLSHHNLKTNDRIISYLPLAHMAERGSLAMAYAIGMQFGFYSGDKNWTVQQVLKEDLQVLQPTLFIGVPRILERLASAIKGKFAASGFMKPIINYAVKTKL
jgi:long-chain acyl-CoA synthetase